MNDDEGGNADEGSHRPSKRLCLASSEDAPGLASRDDFFPMSPRPGEHHSLAFRGSTGEREQRRHPCVVVQIVTAPDAVVLEFVVWGPLAAGVQHAPIFGHVFDLDSLHNTTVAESAQSLRAALAALENLGIVLPARTQPPEDKTRLSFPVLGWYLQMLADIAESYRYRAPLTHSLLWRVSPRQSVLA